jgi:Tol biopolymer transport system component
MWGRAIAVAICAGLCIGLAAPAHATFPGQNGKIAYTVQTSLSNFDIATINSDGSGQTQLTSTSAPEGLPQWSADGSKIVFTSQRDGNDEIYSMDANGSNVARLTTSSGADRNPDWSPDGSKIAFDSDRDGNGEVYVMNADGSAQTRLTNDPASNGGPLWSPDGAKLVFSRIDLTQTAPPDRYDIYTVNPDGSGLLSLTGDARNTDDFWPTWSRNGTKIAWHSWDPASSSAIWTMNPDGSGKQRITEYRGDSPGYQRWSPVGSKLLFNWVGPPGDQGERDVFTMNSDGTDARRLTRDHDLERDEIWSPDGSQVAGARTFCTEGGCPLLRLFVMRADGTGLVELTQGRDPDWQPIPIKAYPRPKGATPFLTYLVPAYAECTAPNRAHGPPLPYSSCAPPTQTSDALTVGSADSNGKPTKSVSSVRFDTVVGNPSTPADEADVKITAEITDVYTQAGLADYAGAVTTKTTLRITDKLNTPDPGGTGVGTVSDIPYGFTIPCAETADTTIGGACLLSTSADALAPGAVTEGKRSIWGLGQVAVYDANGDPFMKQGIFVP